MLQLPHTETGANVAPPTTEEFASAFQELEDKVCDCANMAKIAAQLLSGSDRRQYPDEVVFAVFHACNMIQDLKKAYYAHYRGEQ
ncbi:hypothetical protein [Bradyrhizobium sp. 192]|uniref:hypothetical protein n=1 Tax=Bradyrhizobium sp. 192 TaxID=2782660 RepID=UPI00200029D9|nr:hypothetical protein [Bradyrhizobium sp. 192]UPJ56008.1 hypothetical protein IVB24_25695 [Bradyrhizobium sp. 192]